MSVFWLSQVTPANRSSDPKGRHSPYVGNHCSKAVLNSPGLYFMTAMGICTGEPYSNAHIVPSVISATRSSLLTERLTSSVCEAVDLYCITLLMVKLKKEISGYLPYSTYILHSCYSDPIIHAFIILTPCFWTRKHSRMFMLLLSKSECNNIFLKEMIIKLTFQNHIQLDLYELIQFSFLNFLSSLS